MKRCPTCDLQYSDLTLNFCLQDGTSLVELKQSSIETVAFRQPVTVENVLNTQQFSAIPKPELSTVFPRQVVETLQPPRRSRAGSIAMILSAPLLILFAGGGFGVWYFQTQKQNADRTNFTAVENQKTSEVPAPAKPAAPTDMPDKSDNSTGPGAPADMDAARKVITTTVTAWKAAAENHKAADYAAFYGDKVEYFDDHGIAPSEIKARMQKIFDSYSEIDIAVSNMVIAIDAEGDAATAIFDKEWSYVANPKLTEGKAHMKLHFRKTGNQWKIVVEEELKTYYTEN